MARAPAVSIVLPTHNRAALLPRAVRSVLGQTFKDFELLIADDGSTDGTAAVVASFADPRIVYLPSPRRQGANAARNRGIAAAKGEFVAFQDSDDEWLPDNLRAKVEALRAAPSSTGVVFSRMELRQADGLSRLVPSPREAGLSGDLRRRLLRSNVIGTPVAVVRRECLAAAGPFDAALPRLQEWDLWLRVAQRHRFLFLPEVLVVAHQDDAGISSNARAQAEALQRILAKHTDAFRRHPRDRAFNEWKVACILLAEGDLKGGRAWAARSWRHAPWALKRALVPAAPSALLRAWFHNKPR
jgi:glycosyltransferase involved in cell wall biosynthesis